MRKKYILILFSLLELNVFAQSKITIVEDEQVVGKNSLSGKEIKAKEFIFPEKIHKTYIDTLTNCITVQLRGTSKNGKWLNNKGDIVLYDLEKKDVKWSKKINYQKDKITQRNTTIILTVGNKSYCLDYESGENQWQTKNEIYYIEPFKQLGLGYKGKSNTLEGIDLSTGKIRWKKELTREYGWNDIFLLTDSSFVVVAAGLHEINVNTGSGWDYNMITGQKDYTATAITNAAGVVLGVLTGTFVISTGHDLVRDIVSNVLVDSANIYLASKEQIVCLNHDGQFQWHVSLPEKIASKSSIFKKDQRIYMINRGIAFMGYKKLDYGTPFIAAFDSESGRQIYLKTTGEKKEPVQDFKIQQDTVLLLFKDRISKYSMLDGSLNSDQPVDIQKNNELYSFVGNQVYIKTDSIYQRLLLSDTTKHYLYTASGQILELDDHLNIAGQINSDQLYIQFMSDKGYAFISQGNHTIVIDKNGKEVAHLDISAKSTKIGSKIYNIQGNSYFEIDIEDIIVP